MGPLPARAELAGDVALACGLLCLVIPAVGASAGHVLDQLGWSLGLGLAAVVLGVLGLLAAHRGLAIGTGAAVGGLGLGVVGAGISASVLGLFHLLSRLADWFFQSITF